MIPRIFAAACGCALAVSTVPAHAEPCPGTYLSHDSDVNGELDLVAGGRFQYTLAYGALHEVAQGHWHWTGDRLVLASDPVVPPEFLMVSDDPLTETRLKVDLDLPDGIPLQYFNVVLQQRDGAIRGLQFAADGLDVALDPAHPPAALRIDLPVLDYSSKSFALSPGGHSIRLRFVPHDLGKAMLDNVALTEQGTTLSLDRHERTFVFVRDGRCAGP